MPDDTSLNTSGINVAEIAFKSRTDGDCVPDSVTDELARRAEITFEQKTTSDIWPGVTPPEDTSLIWWAKDPVSGARIGVPKIYSVTLKEWIPLTGSLTAPQALRARRNGSVAVSAGTSVVNFDFDSLETTNYHISIFVMSPSSPGNLDTFGWTVVAMSNSQFSVDFRGVPAAGMTAKFVVEANSL